MKYFCVILILMAAIVVTGNAQIAVIVNNSNPIAKITPGSLKDIYLLSTLKWSDGMNIAVLDNREKSIQKKFYDFIGARDIMSVKKQWLRFQLSGEGKAPETVDSDNEMLSKVASTPGAIGYLRLSEVKGNDVKVIAQIE
jgi:ABC-type phosphate transport system substrate-binding protein